MVLGGTKFYLLLDTLLAAMIRSSGGRNMFCIAQRYAVLSLPLILGKAAP